MKRILLLLTITLATFAAPSQASDVTIGFSGGKWLRFTWNKYYYVSHTNADYNAWCSWRRAEFLKLYPVTKPSFLDRSICRYKGSSPSVSRYTFDIVNAKYVLPATLVHKSGYQSGTYGNGAIGNLGTSYSREAGFTVERDRTSKRARVCAGYTGCTAWMYNNSHNLSALNVIKRAKQYGRSIAGHRILWVKWNNNLI